MGTVYLAEHVKMGRKSAIKVMNPGMVSDADAISRFNREASNASRINHPNVAAVYDFGETSDGLIYLAMEFIEGPSLTKVIEDNGCLPPARAAEITRQAADALSVAHDMGIVHRDLKPDNIMLARGRDGADIVKVVDFGIAKAANNEAQKVTKTGLVVGTPEYMSPEQLAGDKLDGRSDTYSLGLVAFAMLTGKLPFPAETVQESMILRLTDQPKRLAEMRADIPWPPEAQPVMDKVLERDANNRYQSAAEFGRVLHKAISTMESAMTHATAVMGRMSSPKKQAATVPDPDATLRPSATRPVPVTRVNKASQPLEAPTLSRATKSRTPMFAGIGVAVIAVGIGGYLAMQAGKGDAATANGNVTGQGQPPAAPTAPAFSLADAFVVLDSLTDAERSANANTANRAFAIVDSIAPQVQSDEDKVHLDFVRAESHFLVSSDSTTPVARQRTAATDGCRILKNMEGRASRTRFKQRVEFYLYGDRPNGIAATC